MKWPTTVWEVVPEAEINYTMDFNSMQKLGKTKRFEEGLLTFCLTMIPFSHFFA